MEKMSRMRKYKDLRENIKTDVVSESPTVNNYTFNQEEEKAVQLRTPDHQDTLVEGMTIDTINSQKNEQLERALNRVREETNQEENFDTRIDILNKIRQSRIDETEMMDEDTDEHPLFQFQEQKEEEQEPIFDEVTEEVKAVVEDVEDNDDEEDEDASNPTYVKILNGIIIILAIILVGLLGYIVKEFLI